MSEVYCIVHETAKLSKPTRKVQLNEVLAYNNAQAHAMRVTLFENDGTAADLTGASATGSFKRADGQTVEPINGTISENVAEIILPASCYVAPGRFTFTMNLNKTGGYARTILWVNGIVERNTTDEIVDPGTPVGNIEQAIGQATAAAASATSAASAANTAAQAATAAASSSVRYDTDQTLTETQQATARDNIGAAAAEDVADLKSALDSKMVLDGTRTFVNATPNIGFAQILENGNISTVSNNNYNNYLEISVLPGEVYEFTGCTYSESSPMRKALIFGDSNNRWISVKDGAFIREKVVVPKDAVKMYVNGRIGQKYLPAAFKITDNFDVAVTDTLKSEYGSWSYSDYDVSELTVYDGFLKYESPNTETITAGTGYHHIIIPVQYGERWKYFNSSQRDTVQCEVVNSINCRSLRMTNADLSEDAEIIIPDSGAKLIINYVESDTWKIQKGTVSVKTGGDTTIVNNVTNTFGSSEIINIPTPAGIGAKRWDYVFADNFHREDNTSSLGNPGNADYDRSYTALVGTLGITGNKAYKVDGTTAIAYKDVGLSDCTIDFMVDMSNLGSSPFGAGIAFRIKDSSNYMLCIIHTTTISCYKFETGQERERIIYQSIPSFSGMQKFSIVLDGNRIALYINGLFFKETATSFNASETKHGIAIYGASVTSKVTMFDIRYVIPWRTVNDTLDLGIRPYYFNLENVGAEHSFKFVSSPVKNSEKSMEFCVKKSDNYKRSEMSCPKNKPLGEQIISFDMMLGDDYAIQDLDDGIIWQFHDTPEDAELLPENAGIGPDVSCRIRGGKYIVHRQWDSIKPSTPSTITTSDVELDDDPLDDIGKWVHWDIHIKWGWEAFFDPFLYIYKDGVLAYSAIGLPNTVNATQGAYFKIGPYPVNYVLHPEYGTSVSRTMWIDNFVFTN